MQCNLTDVDRLLSQLLMSIQLPDEELQLLDVLRKAENGISNYLARRLCRVHREGYFLLKKDTLKDIKEESASPLFQHRREEIRRRLDS